MESSIANFETWYKTAVTKTMYSCHNDRHINQETGTESPEMNPHISV